MQLMHSSRARCADPSADRAAVTRQHASHTRDARLRRIAALAFVVFLSAVLGACSSGGGGDNGEPNPRDEVTATGLNFTYPFDGQTDVLLDSELVIQFAGDVGDVSDDALVLQYEADDGTSDAQPLTITQDDNQPGILCLAIGEDVELEENYRNLCIQGGGDLEPNATYSVVAQSEISDGTTTFGEGDTLFRFKTRPMEGQPASGAFEVTEVTPGETNELTGETSVFPQFAAIRVVLNEPVDPATVNDNTFIVTDPNGDQITTGTDGSPVEARLTALGRYIVFDPLVDDPSKGDLEPGQYTIEWTDGIRSQFGKNLAEPTNPITRVVQKAVGSDPDNPNADDESLIKLPTIIEPTVDAAGLSSPEAIDSALDDIPDNNLDGGPTNNVNISSQLLGSNDQPAQNAPGRGGVTTFLANTHENDFGDTIPAVIRAGQQNVLLGLNLRLNGDVDTPIQTGFIDVRFNNDVTVNLTANDYRNIETPTAVRLRFDLGLATLIDALAASTSPNAPEDPTRAAIIQSLGNGLFSQSALNIQGAGLAVPQDNGDLKISTLGSFPVNVNHSGNATVDFQLTFTLPNDTRENLLEVGADLVPPTITAQMPSACLYTFGSPLFDIVATEPDSPFLANLPPESAEAARGVIPSILPEQNCNSVLSNGGMAAADGPFVTGFPIESSIAIVTTEAIDPSSVNADTVTFTGITPDGNSEDRTSDATYRVEGSTIVINPDELLTADTAYTVSLSGITDLAGNTLQPSPQAIGGPTTDITFTTEPRVDSTREAPPFLASLSPGVPCALEGGDFTNGQGTNAGNCVGDTGEGTVPFDVFENPTNVGIEATFSKLVSTDSIQLAEGCLTGGGPTSGEDTGATVAIQIMNGSTCTGVVDGEIAFANESGPGTVDDSTRGFTFRPTGGFVEGQRYWIVLCGTDGSSCSAQITDGTNALNTTPLLGTGSTGTSGAAAGGPDIVMPFEATAATEDFFATQITFPYADTNGNGQFDDLDGNGTYNEGEERPQAANRALVNLSSLGIPINNPDREDDGAYPSYLALGRPVAIRETLTGAACDAALSGITHGGSDTSVVGEIPNECIKVSLQPGGFSSLTSINLGLDAVGGLLSGLLDLETITETLPLTEIPLLGSAFEPEGILGGVLDPALTTLGDLLNDTTGALDTALAGLLPNALSGVAKPIQTGRILLSFPNVPQATDGGTDTQNGYIVEKCTGTLPSGLTYDYEPCFAASLTLVAHAPDGQLVSVDQQTVPVDIYGPVAFEQNGRQVISVRNANTQTLDANISLGELPLLPATATINPGNLTFQLVGAPTHGGREFPNR